MNTTRRDIFANSSNPFRIGAIWSLVLTGVLSGCGGGSDDFDPDSGLDTDRDGFTDYAENFLDFDTNSAASSPCGGGGAKGAVAFKPGAGKSARTGFVDSGSGRLLHSYQSALPVEARVGAAEGPPDVIACATHRTANDSSCIYIGGASCAYARPYRIADLKLYAAVDGIKLSEFSVRGLPNACPQTITVIDGRCPTLNFGGDVAPSAVMSQLQAKGFLVRR